MEIKCAMFKYHGVLARFERSEAATYLESLVPCSLDALQNHWQVYGEKVGFPKELSAEATFFKGFWDSLAAEYSMDDEAKERLAALDFSDFLTNYSESLGALRLAQAHGVDVVVMTAFPSQGDQEHSRLDGLASQVNGVHSSLSQGRLVVSAADFLHMRDSMGLKSENVLCFVDDQKMAGSLREEGFVVYLVDRSQHFHHFDDYEICDLYGLVDIFNSRALSQAS